VFSNGQHIWYRVYGRRDNVTWAAGTIVITHSTKIYSIVNEQGHLVGTQHQDQSRRRATLTPPVAEPPPDAAGPAEPLVLQAFAEIAA